MCNVAQTYPVVIVNDSQQKTQRTIDIEAMLREGHSVATIARWAGVSQQRVSYIKKRLFNTTPTTPVVTTPAPVSEAQSCIVASVLKPITLHLTPSVFDALTEACAVVNRQDPDDPVTLADYVEELVINRVVELGLLRKTKRR